MTYVLENIVNIIRTAVQWVYNWIVSLACSMFYPVLVGVISAIPDGLGSTLDWSVIRGLYALVDYYLPLAWIWSLMQLHSSIVITFWVIRWLLRLLQRG